MTHLSSILVLYLCGEVRVQGVLGGKVLQVLTVGQLVAHVHVQQQGGLVCPLGGGGGGRSSHTYVHTCGVQLEYRLIAVHTYVLYVCLSALSYPAHAACTLLHLPAPGNVSDRVATSSQDQGWKTKAFDILDTLTKQETVLQYGLVPIVNWLTLFPPTRVP